MARVRSRPIKRLGLPAGQWHPELVGRVQGYPKTEAIWQARSDLMRQQIKLYHAEGITGRNGVKDGWAGKKTLINQINQAAAAEARDLVEKMIELERFKPDNVEARIALEAAVAIIAAEKHTPENQPVPLYDAKERLGAIKTVLEFTQRKPVSSVNSRVHMTAEDFLAQVLADVTHDE